MRDQKEGEHRTGAATGSRKCLAASILRVPYPRGGEPISCRCDVCQAESVFT